MKYYIDTEFQEGFHKPLFGKRRHFIDLVSIAIVAEDGREFYAISEDFNPRDASPWVKENVLSKLPDRRVSFYDSPSRRSGSLLWKPNKLIANEIKEFVGVPNYYPKNSTMRNSDTTRPVFYAYYADYDWVLFCALFGTMMDLPKGFPMYCKDLKQTLDETRFECSNDVSMWGKDITQHPDYPKQTNEHNALDDARWNKSLHKFLISLRK